MAFMLEKNFDGSLILPNSILVEYSQKIILGKKLNFTLIKRN